MVRTLVARVNSGRRGTRGRSLLHPAHAFVLLYVVLVAVPLYFLIVTAVKSPGEFFAAPLRLPSTIRWDNFARVLTQGSMIRYAANSLVVSGLSVLLTIVTTGLVAFAISRVELARVGRTILLVFMVGLMIPPQVEMIPLYVQMQRFAMIDSLPGLILVHVAHRAPFGVFVYHGFLLSVPRALEDSAIVDGCHYGQVLRHIIAPLMLAPTVVIAIQTAIYTWNDFFFPLLLLRSPARFPIPLGLWSFIGENTTQVTLVFAGVMMSAIPVAILYFVFQKRLVQGLAAGALKG